jgi:ribosomal protein S18 acetylase RimI-like enzyme
MLDDMIATYLGSSNPEEMWFTATIDGKPVSIGFCAAEKLTRGTFNLYAIGVKADLQGKGIGEQIMKYIEHQLQQKGGRVLIVETSGTEDFQLTRRFYEKLNYNKEAVIRDFWSEGDDKVIFWKKLNA